VFTVGKVQRDEVTVPACTRTIIEQKVFISNSNIPYIVSMTLRNGIA